MAKLTIVPENAEKISTWLKTRGGVAIWNSVNLSNPGGRWLTPKRQETGEDYTKPTWQAENTPEIITVADDILVAVPKLVKTLRIALRIGRQGLSIKLTDASSRRVLRAEAEAGEGSWHEFGGYDGQDCLIYKTDRLVPLTQFVKEG